MEVKTKKGTVLPLINLKGKQYLQVAHRIQWFTEEVPSFHISTAFLTINEEETVAQVIVLVLDEKGQPVRKAVGTKRETAQSFADHTEKAETGALGRALIQLGFGTQFALADLDEGDRIVDAPVTNTRASQASATPKAAPLAAVLSKEGSIGSPSTSAAEVAPTKKASFRNPKKTKIVQEEVPTASDNGSDGTEWIS